MTELKGLNSFTPFGFMGSVSAYHYDELSRQGHYAREKEVYDELVKEAGIPSHLVEHQPGILIPEKRYGTPEPSWDDLLYKKYRKNTFFADASQWMEFRAFQNNTRNIYADEWPEYQSKVRESRRKYRLKGDIILNRDLTLQDTLTTWLEYQYYHHKIFQKVRYSLDYERELMITQLFKLESERLSPYRRTDHGYQRSFYHPELLTWKIQDREKIRAPLAMVVSSMDADHIDLYSDWQEVAGELWIAEHNLSTALKFPSGLVDMESWVQELDVGAKKYEGQYRAYRQNPSQNQGDRSVLRMKLRMAAKALKLASADFEKTIDREVLLKKFQRQVNFTKNEAEPAKMAVQVLSLMLSKLSWGTLYTLSSHYKNYCSLLDWIDKQRQFIETQHPGHNHQNRQKRISSHEEKITGPEDNCVQGEVEFMKQPQCGLQGKVGCLKQPQLGLSPQENSKKPRKRVHWSDPIESPPPKPRTTRKRSLEDNPAEEDNPQKKQKMDAEDTESRKTIRQTRLAQVKPRVTRKRSLEDNSTEDGSPRKKQKMDVEDTESRKDIRQASLTQIKLSQPISMQAGSTPRKARPTKNKDLTGLLKSITKRKWAKFVQGGTLTKTAKLKQKKALLKQISQQVEEQ